MQILFIIMILIHGDAFMGNLIGGATGPAIYDFDSSRDGPREWDLVPLAVGTPLPVRVIMA